MNDLVFLYKVAAADDGGGGLEEEQGLFGLTFAHFIGMSAVVLAHRNDLCGLRGSEEADLILTVDPAVLLKAVIGRADKTLHASVFEDAVEDFTFKFCTYCFHDLGVYSAEVPVPGSSVCLST